MNTKGNGKNVGNKANVSFSSNGHEYDDFKGKLTSFVRLDTRRYIVGSLKLKKKVNSLC